MPQSATIELKTPLRFATLFACQWEIIQPAPYCSVCLCIVCSVQIVGWLLKNMARGVAELEGNLPLVDYF
jgi:hypothetical protein